MTTLIANFYHFVRVAFVDLVLNGFTNGEKYSIKISKNINTAYWDYRTFPKKCHNIVIGNKIFDNIMDNEENAEDYALSFIYHEFGHSWFTDRDMKAINAALQAESIPFGLHNLFEDARIEHLVRNKTSRDFKWLDFEKAPIKEDTNPEKILFCIIQSENNERVFEKLIDHNPDKEDIAYRVAEYYDRIIETESTMHLIPILKEWIDEFGAEKQEERLEELRNELNEIGSGGSTLMPSVEPLTESAKGKAEEDAEVVAGEDMKSPSGEKEEFVEAGQMEITGWESCDKESFWRDPDFCPEPVDQKRLAPLTKKIERAFELKGYSYQSSINPSKKLHIRNIARGSDKMFKKKIKADDGVSVKKITLVIDCSGSMDGTPMNEGRYLYTAINQLARKGKITGNIILSAVHNYSNISQVLPLPVSQDFIDELIASHGAEGIQGNIKHHMDIIKGSDYVLVYTDGNIRDTPMEKRELHKYGLFSYGLYAGSYDMAESLTRYFDRCISRNTIEEVIEKFTTMLRSHK